MARQTRDQVNARRRIRYSERMSDTHNAIRLRNLGVISDRAGGLSYRKIAAKWGVSLGCVQKIIQRCQ